MQFTARRSALIVIFALISVVVTQLIYIGMRQAGMEFNSQIVWTVEAVAFLAVSVFALVPLAQSRIFGAAWAAIAFGGAFNLIQVGMGLAMFGPLQDGGDAMAPAFQAILAGAFFLYFAGKFLFGFAALVIGLVTLRGPASGAAKAIGALAALTGLGALVTNLLGMSVGMDHVMLAGGAGTAATLFLALAIGQRLPD